MYIISFDILKMYIMVAYFYLDDACDDIDECLSGTHDCLTPDIETCFNTVGSYACESINPEDNEGECGMSFELNGFHMK